MADERPGLWVGHVAMTSADPSSSHDFFIDAGMRTILRGDDMAILELRGGTHLLLFRGEASPGPAPFDLMVEDLDATHGELSGRGLRVSEITRGEIHDAFTLTDPDGHDITVQNSHVTGVV
jgi:Glyoxalase-like domain